MTKINYITHLSSSGDERKIAVVDGQPYYQSTGESSRESKVWFPFFMISCNNEFTMPESLSRDYNLSQLRGAGSIFNFGFFIKYNSVYLRKVDYLDDRLPTRKTVVTSLRLGKADGKMPALEEREFTPTKTEQEEINKPIEVLPELDTAGNPLVFTEPYEINTWLKKNKAVFVNQIDIRETMPQECLAGGKSEYQKVAEEFRKHTERLPKEINELGEKLLIEAFKKIENPLISEFNQGIALLNLVSKLSLPEKSMEDFTNAYSKWMEMRPTLVLPLSLKRTNAEWVAADSKVSAMIDSVFSKTKENLLPTPSSPQAFPAKRFKDQILAELDNQITSLSKNRLFMRDGSAKVLALNKIRTYILGSEDTQDTLKQVWNDWRNRNQNKEIMSKHRNVFFNEIRPGVKTSTEEMADRIDGFLNPKL